ncbi:MAG: cellulase family glycosylhydrolase [Gemmataceae bacterium]
MTAARPTRRRFLHATGAVAGAVLTSAAAPAMKPTLHAYRDYGWLRGFGIVPSWGARIEEAWWFYDPGRFREEVALAKQVHANCIRLWIEFTAWMADPDKITARFLDAVAGIAENGMKVMPCLFNRWHDARFDYGGSQVLIDAASWQPQLAYVRALVKPLATDDRILLWDLCNEPAARDPKTPEYAWLSDVAATVRACGARQPITIGTMTGSNVTTYAPLVDVLCGHPYAHDRAGLAALIAEFQTMQKATGKPFLVNETIPGALDDPVRAGVTRFYTEMLSAAGFGWMGWVIREGKAISTRRDRHDANGIHGGGFHPFFTRDGKLRGGLEFLTEKPKRSPPWKT